MATLYDYYQTGADQPTQIDTANDRVAQTFTTTVDYSISAVALRMLRAGGTGTPGMITVSIRTTLAGEPTTTVLATGTTNGNTLTTDAAGEWRTITFTSITPLSVSTKYAIVINVPGASDVSQLWIRYDFTDATYDDGEIFTSGDGETSWDAVDVGAFTSDIMFRCYGGGSGSSTAPVDKRFSKQLVTACNNEIWYESAADTMSELTAAHNDIDTIKPLQMFELYEKVFVVNGTNKKVIDFGNTKLYDADVLTTKPTHGQVIYQNGADPAEMVVDFINGDASQDANYIYGKVIGGTFETGTAITTVSGGGGSTIMTPDTVTAPTTPHWYDWTVYNNHSTYGTMPTQATLGCPWRGRACLSGDEDYPHQYYQTRQENPWDMQYVSVDVQSPIAGGGDPSIPGQVGDIVIAQIPFDRDHLIYGGANSLWVLTGDAAEGGTLNCFYDEGGILGAAAWAKDNKNNLYIMSTAGLLRIPQGFGPPENLTEFTYPDFIKDLAYSSSTHRIVMGYDRKRNGVKIQRVTLATGANTGWWWDLKAEALFPESYGSTEHGIFSMFHYEAVDPDYNCLLLGCNNGYLYYEDGDATDDTLADDTAQLIDSYVTFGPIKLGEENREGKVNSLVGVLAGGGVAAGSETDSDNVDFKIWTELSADKISERFSANSGQKISGTIKAPGRWRGNQWRRSIRGMFAGLRIGNNTAGKIWGLERLLLGIKRGGKVK